MGTPNDFRLSQKTAMEALEQARREREALEASYNDFRADILKMAESAQTLTEKPEVPTEFFEVITRLTNYVEMEREQSARLFRLLLDAYVRLQEAYED
jgi:hypothetical protein